MRIKARKQTKMDSYRVKGKGNIKPMNAKKALKYSYDDDDSDFDAAIACDEQTFSQWNNAEFNCRS